MAALERGGRPDLVPPRRPRPRHVPRAHRAARATARRLTEAHAEVVRRHGRRGARAADVRRAGAHLRAHARGEWRPFQEFMIVEQARGPVEAVELRGIERARPTPEVLAAVAEAEAIVIGPSNPVDLDRPDPGAAGNARGAVRRRRPGRGRQPVRRRPRGQGPDRGVLRAGGHRAERHGGRRRLRADCSTAWSPTRRPRASRRS